MAVEVSNIRRLVQKELLGFFSSLTAFIFFGAFLSVTLFIFFWVDTFFARNICDVRPMFEWMPVLLIFLVPALTMRMWSEERRSGTLEFLLTVPVSNLELVLGKFAACLALVGIAMALTLPIPITVAMFLGQLDWGPVFGGYVATLFLAASYAAIGLYVSARTDNQIVSLLMSVLICSLLFLSGSDAVTSLFNSDISEVMKLFGSGSRFQSITRGVIDFRDLYYYLSLTGVFLSLNVLGLEKLRWAGNLPNSNHKTWNTISALVIANFIAANFWLQQVSFARADLTDGHLYSISQATRTYLSRLQEPLLIRAYISKKTHPYLAPLAPRLRDLLKEYAIAGNGKVHVEFVDPLEKPALEKEAGEKYGIKPVVFQTTSKYQAALTNSYFDLLIKYGDQFEKLSFKDLIEVKAHGERDVQVDLRNPEYDITSAIKKVIYSYQGAGNIFLGIEKPVKFVGYISPDNRLPEELVKLKELLKETLQPLEKQSDGKLSVEFTDPDAGSGEVAKQIESQYGFRRMAVGLLDPHPFWFYMTLKSGEQVAQVPLPDDLEHPDKAALERDIKAGLKRFSKGFLKTVGLYAARQPLPQPGGGPDPSGDIALLREKLADTYSVETVTFRNGQVPTGVDVLLLIAPQHLNDKDVFAIDQYLMHGGTVIAETAPFDASMDRDLLARKVESGLDDWLQNNGIEIQRTMVLDPQNFELPIPVTRSANGYMVQELQYVPYPYFVDVRQDGISKDGRINAGIDHVIVDWGSPISLDDEKNKQRRIIRLLQSSPDSWTSASPFIRPSYSEQQKLGFPVGKEKGSKLLAAIVEGEFESFFKGKKSPLSGNKVSAKEPPSTSTSGGAASQAGGNASMTNILEKSPESARIIVFATNSFLSDKMIMLASAGSESRYLGSLDLIENVIDWSLADRDLLSIRGRGHFARTLRPLDQGSQSFFEYLNYGLALLGLVAVWRICDYYRSQDKKRYQKLLARIAKPTVAEEIKA